MKTRLLNAIRWFTHGTPEVLLGLFLLIMVPMVLMVVLELGRQVGMMAANFRQYVGAAWQAPWPAISSLVCIGGTALLAMLVLRNWAAVWAVARKMIIEALHRKVILVLLIFFVVLVPALPFMLRAEGSLKSHVQLVLLYSLGLSLALMSLVAICVTTASICSEVERRYVHITDTKPARRWQFLLGKWFGVIVLCTVALMCMGGIGYVLVRYTASRAVYGRHTGSGDPYARKLSEEALGVPEEDSAGDAGAEKKEKDRERIGIHDYSYDPLKEEVFVSRRTTRVYLDEKRIKERVDKAVEQYRQEFKGQRVPIHAAADDARRQYLGVMNSVLPGKPIVWEFGGLDKDRSVTVRFKAHATGNRMVFGYWEACDKRLEVDGEGRPTGKLRYTRRLDKNDNPIPVVVAPDTGWASGTFHEIPLRPGCVGEDGFLYLRYFNSDPRAPTLTSVTFDVEDLIEVMQREGSFLTNYYRSLWVILVHVALLAALGLMAGSLFSFPVATFLVVGLFVGGLLAPWFHSQFVVPNIYARLTEGAQMRDTIWRAFARFIVALMPNFGEFSPLDKLVHGKMVTWGHVARSGAVLFYLKGGVALVIAFYFYARRELARSIV